MRVDRSASAGSLYPDPQPLLKREHKLCALNELDFGNRTPAMFSKANLPTGTLSGYLTGSPIRSTNFHGTPLLPQSNGHRYKSAIHDDNTVISPLTRK